MEPNSISLHRVIKSSPEKIYRAYIDPLALASWMPPYGFLAIIHHMDPVIGGTFKTSFVNFSTGNKHSFGGTYLDMKENEFIKYSDKFDDPNLKSEMITSVWLKKVICGTEVKILQENIPSEIPLELCYLGWQESLEKLKNLVEPEIKEGN